MRKYGLYPSGSGHVSVADSRETITKLEGSTNGDHYLTNLTPVTFCKRAMLQKVSHISPQVQVQVLNNTTSILPRVLQVTNPKPQYYSF
jgi:hypothetical protein